MKSQRTIELLDRAYGGLRHLFRGLPYRRLSPRERTQLGGQRFRGDTELTAEVVLGLRRAPELFPDAAGAADQIEEDAALAELWLSIALLLRGLFSLAMDSYLYHGAQALKRSRQVLQQVRAGYENPALCPHLDNPRRVNLLEYPLRLAHGTFAARAKKRREPRPPGKEQQRERRRLRELMFGRRP